MESRLDVAVLEDTREFAALEEEWEALYRDSRRATPFQSWAWLYSWWESYGEGYELRLVTLRDHERGLLVGLIPLVLERRRGFGRLLFVGTGRTDYLDILARDGWESQVSNASRYALKRLHGWQVADLQGLHPGAAAWDVFQRWDRPRTRVWQAGCPVINVKPWDELVGSLSKNHRSTTRRTIRRAEADGVSREPARPEDAARAARTLVALHRELWRGRDIVPDHSTQRWGSFIEAAAVRMIAHKLGGISEFRRDGEVIISLFWIFGQDFVGFYHSGVSQETLQRYQWNSLLVRAGIDIAYERNSACLDLLRGEEPYKLQWASKVIPNYRVILGRNPIVWVPYAGYRVLRPKIKRYVDAESTPQWFKKAAYWLQRSLDL